MSQNPYVHNPYSKESVPSPYTPSNEVFDFLRSLELEDYYTSFIQGHIHSLATLSKLKAEDLKEIGLPVGPRRIVLSEIQSWNNTNSSQADFMNYNNNNNININTKADKLVNGKEIKTNEEELKTKTQSGKVKTWIEFAFFGRIMSSGGSYDDDDLDDDDFDDIDAYGFVQDTKSFKRIHAYRYVNDFQVYQKRISNSKSSNSYPTNSNSNDPFSKWFQPISEKSQAFSRSIHETFLENVMIDDDQNEETSILFYVRGKPDQDYNPVSLYSTVVTENYHYDVDSIPIIYPHLGLIIAPAVVFPICILCSVGCGYFCRKISEPHVACCLAVTLLIR
eukprot:gb/GECH01012693.1/.p1 GENE.gb/GECH01012693.1/~~gb/GECH01012693.1/.p1  ORF type:complete len:335 (+),score=81.09 gb/GECH01012693.1/:1-1005(+)